MSSIRSIKMSREAHLAMDRLLKKKVGLVFSHTDRQALETVNAWALGVAADIVKAVDLLETNDPGQSLTQRLKSWVVVTRRRLGA